jgi:hypothetical protein
MKNETEYNKLYEISFDIGWERVKLVFANENSNLHMFMLKTILQNNFWYIKIIFDSFFAFHRKDNDISSTSQFF